MVNFSELKSLPPRVVKLPTMLKTQLEVLDLLNYTRPYKSTNPVPEFVVTSKKKLGRILRSES
ncbi:hypothetical protein [Streptococcus hyointestinalis]|uniref:hypothetical protein n=1 Tax=Streptococcus hyointestinalis TaxID=1337 RepID=UPI0013E01258|nr:hypothetical protein [Streptococcus hyointestinalis]